MPEARVARLARRAALAVMMLLVGAVHVYPDLRFVHDLGSDYKGVHFIAAVDETTYLSRISRVLGGDYRLGNAMIIEHRDDPFTYAPLPEYVLGTLGRLLGLSIARLDVAATFVLPALVFLLFFVLVRALTASFAVSLVGSVVLVLGQYLIAKDSPLLHLRLYDPGFPHSLQFVRPVSPQFHYVVFLLALWLLYRVYVGRDGAASMAAAGAAWGLCFYLNLFFWTFLACGLGLWVAAALLTGDRRRARAGAVVLATGVAVGAYYFVNAYRAAMIPGFHEALLRAGFIYGHRPILPAVHVAWFLLFLAWLARRRDSTPGRFVLLFLLSGLICLNQQVLTGRTVQPFHWETQTDKLFMLLALLVVVADWLALAAGTDSGAPGRRRRAASLALAGIVLVVVPAHSVLLQQNYYRVSEPRYSRLQEIGPALAWLARETPPDSVVLASPTHHVRSELVAVYARRFTYLSEPFFTISLIPQREVDDRYLLAMLAFGFGEPGLRQVLEYSQGALLLGMYALPYYHRGDDRAIRRHLDLVAERYRRLQADPGSVMALRAFALDYVLASAAERPELRLGVLGETRAVYSDGRFAIFAVGRGR